ncbi:MAG TPA: zinc-dependent alcohol dehydrogenase family protein [Ramlibacter sp.]|nr:zinc-dependent alcohol dehydrogenase family protein [Ramlibacter sp.]
MKAVRFSTFGRACEVAELVDIPEPAPPGPGDILFQLEAAPVNPSDLLHFAGRYGEPLPLPSFAGAGVLGRVLQLGAGVSHLKAGDRVIVVNTDRAGWRERFVWPAAALAPLPAADPADLALLAANPPTALLMLETFAVLQLGDWVIQNAANSSVGVSLIQIARAKGLRTVNVVRRPELVRELQVFGPDVVLVDGPDLRDRMREAIGDGRIRLGIDAIAGEATGRLASCVDEGGTVVNYGLLSGTACRIEPADVLFRNVSLKGFWYMAWLRRSRAEDISSLFGRLVAMQRSGDLKVPVEAVYAVRDLNRALEHAERPAKLGKVVVRWS